MKKLILATALAATTLSGCGVFRGDRKPATPTVGQRIDILTAENAAEPDPALAATAVVLPPAEANTDWPQPGGNAAKAVGHVALGQALGTVWTARIAGSSPKARLGSGPVVKDGRVYAVDSQGVVHAFQLETGRKLWQAALVTSGKDRRAAFGGGVSADGDKLYATSGLGDVAAFDAATGQQLWKVRPAGPVRGAPTVAYDSLYVMTQDNQIFALRTSDGQTVWNEAGTIESAGVFGAPAPAAAQGTVVAGFSSGELTAFRYENGRAVWQDVLSPTGISTSVSNLSDIDAAPVIDQGRVYAIGQGGRMIALDLISGQRLWEVNIAGLSTPVVTGEWLFVVDNDARVLCLSRQTGKVRWIAQLPRWRDEDDKQGPISWVGPVLAGDRLILASSAGQLVNVAVADGAVGTGIRIGAPVQLAPAVANNMLLVLDNDGRISAWRGN
jgi:outer membrane protein assembly factor BamB